MPTATANIPGIQKEGICHPWPQEASERGRQMTVIRKEINSNVLTIK